MKRKPGTLLKIEVEILAAAKELHRRGDTEFYGYGIARAICDENNARGLTKNGTVYRALIRLETFGFLTSRWEDGQEQDGQRRIPRRLYQLRR